MFELAEFDCKMGFVSVFYFVLCVFTTWDTNMDIIFISLLIYIELIKEDWLYLRVRHFKSVCIQLVNALITCVTFAIFNYTPERFFLVVAVVVFVEMAHHQAIYLIS